MSKALKQPVLAFLDEYARRDSPDLDDSITALLMDDHFYFIYESNCEDNGQGFFVPKDISGLEGLEVDIHSFLHTKKE